HQQLRRIHLLRRSRARGASKETCERCSDGASSENWKRSSTFNRRSARSSEENPGSAARRAGRGLSDPRFTHETGDETSEPRFQRASAWVPCLQRTPPRSAKAWAAKAGARQTSRYLHRPRDRVTRRLPNCRRSIHPPAPTLWNAGRLSESFILALLKTKLHFGLLQISDFSV